MKNKTILIVVAAAVIIGGGMYLFSKMEDSSSEPQAGNSQVKEFNIIAKQFSFEPDTITVNKGDRVKLNITSADVTHGFTISEFGVSADLLPGETKIVEFTASESGTYAFFCSVYCGLGHPNMKGKLIVN